MHGSKEDMPARVDSSGGGGGSGSGGSSGIGSGSTAGAAREASYSVTPLTRKINDSATGANSGTSNTQRRLIKVDFSVLEMDDDDDDDLDDDMDGGDGSLSPGGGRRPRAPWQRTAKAVSLSTSNDEDDDETAPLLGEEEYFDTTPPSFYLNAGETEEYGDMSLSMDATSYDLATQCPTTRRSLSRRHTLGGNALRGSGGAGGGGALGTVLDGTQSLPQSRPSSRGPTPSSASSEAGSQSGLGGVLPELSWSRSSLQDDLLHSKNWQTAMECLSLTLEEIVHIRSVLTKAELESLPVEGHVKEDVEKKKVCFLCLKTRFGIFGPWGQICKLCQRTICNKCCSKMRIPTEHFSRVPVFALSPGLSSPEEERESFPRSLVSRLLVPEALGGGVRASVGSAPSSPGPPARPASGAASSLGGDSLVDGPQSLPALSPSLSASAAASPASAASDRRSRFSRSKTMGRSDTKKEKLKGLQMTVCHDCKTMVLQIIKSSRTSRSNAIRNLTLNLSPVY